MSETVVGDGGENLPHAVLHPHGDIDAYNAGVFRESWDDLEDVKLLVVILNDVPFVDSAGLGVLIGGVRRFRDKGGAIVIVCDREPIARLLRTTGLSIVIGPITESYKKALAVLRDNQG